jgi:hypothetical protein
MMTKLIKVRKNGKYTNVISVTRDVKAGTTCIIREIADPEDSGKKIQVISKESTTTVSKGAKDTIREYKTPDGRLIMREKIVNARKESSSTVLTMTGFVEPGMYYWIDMDPTFVVKQPTYEEIQAELANRNMWGEE